MIIFFMVILAFGCLFGLLAFFAYGVLWTRHRKLQRECVTFLADALRIKEEHIQCLQNKKRIEEAYNQLLEEVTYGYDDEQVIN